MADTQTDYDVAIAHHGSVVGFRPVSDEARAFFDAEVASESWQWLGNALMVEARYAPGLINGLHEYGLVIELER